jgi:hypothetical protein
MASAGKIFWGLIAGSLVFGPVAAAQDQKVKRVAPTAAEWAALAKLPDLTGVWEVAPPARGGRGRGAGAPGAAAGQPRPRGITGGAAIPVLTAEYAAKAQALASQPKAEDNQSANCLPPGMPGIMGQPYPIEILLTPGQATIISEAYTQVRHIYTDGRPLPDDPDPTFYGTSVGRWEGDTLVVETVGFAQVPRGLSFPYSDKMRILERFRLADADTLTVETTITDPEALKMPYSMGTRTYKRHRNWTIAEYICEENNRNFVDEKGKAGINLANPEASPR